MGSAVLIMIVNVEDAASGLGPRVSAMVGDSCFALSDLRNLLNTRLIPLNSGLWFFPLELVTYFICYPTYRGFLNLKCIFIQYLITYFIC